MVTAKLIEAFITVYDRKPAKVELTRTVELVYSDDTTESVSNPNWQSLSYFDWVAEVTRFVEEKNKTRYDWLRDFYNANHR